MAASLTSSTFSSISQPRNSLRPIHQKPANLSFRTMAGDENKINEGAGQIIDGVKDMAGKAGGQAVDMKDKAYKGVQDAETMMGGKAEEGKKSVGDTATAAKDKSLDAAAVAAENTEKTVSGAWEATKGAIPKK